MQGNMPDLTKAQIAAVILFIAGQSAAWSGWIGTARGQLVVGIGSAALAAAWKLADAHLRGKRAMAFLGRGITFLEEHGSEIADTLEEYRKPVDKAGSADLEGSHVVYREDTASARSPGDDGDDTDRAAG